MDSSGMDRIPPAAAGAGTDHLPRTSWGNITPLPHSKLSRAKLVGMNPGSRSPRPEPSP